LLRVILGDPERFEFLWEKQVMKPSGGGEAVAIACIRSLFASNLFNSVASIIAATCDAGDVAVRVALASVIAATTSFPASTVR
jgi:hypothetical protein